MASPWASEKEKSMANKEPQHPIVTDYLEEEDESDINQLDDPADDEVIDYDARRDNEEGDEPVESVGLSPEDFKIPLNTDQVLEQVMRIVDERCKRPLGGPLVASQLKGFCTVTVDELQAIEDAEKAAEILKRESVASE